MQNLGRITQISSSTNATSLSELLEGCIYGPKIWTRSLKVFGARLVNVQGKALEGQETEDEEKVASEKFHPKTGKKMEDFSHDKYRRVPSKKDIRFLMYGSRYDSKDEIPEKVRNTVLSDTYRKVRRVISYYQVMATFLAIVVVIYCGQCDIEKRDRQLLRESDALWEAAERRYAGQRIARKSKES